MVNDEHSLVIWEKLPEGGYVVGIIIFFWNKNLNFRDWWHFMKAKDENNFFVTNWFYIVSGSVTPPASMGQTISSHSEKIIKSDNLRISSYFFDIFSLWFHFLFF